MCARMLLLALGLATALAACVVRQELPTPASPSAFEELRGQALPPPAQSSRADANAPPEGPAAGGFDFGQWRSADPETYGPRFEAAVRARLAGKSRAEIEQDLEANGFACGARGAALECRIEIMEDACARDWYVAIEPARAEPIAGFDVMCLGAL